mgnify:FL=1
MRLILSTEDTNMQIGYVGLGKMGGALAKRLQLQHTLLVHDQNPVAVQTMVELGSTAL